MANILQIPVPTGRAALCWPARSNPAVASVLFINQDLNNTVYLGQDASVVAADVNTIPIPPNGTFSGDSTEAWYVIGSVAGIQPLVMVPNGQAFFRGLSQGAGKLALPQFQSPGYTPGVSGWAVFQNGNAEFNSITIRGTFAGTDFIINNTGCFFYSGPPGFGGLSQSIVPGASTVFDPLDNMALPGFTTYEQSGGTYYANNILASQMVVWTAPAANGPYTQSAAGLFFLTGANTFINALVGQKIELSAPTVADFGLQVLHALTATGGTAGTPTLITTDTWHNITLDAGWTAGPQVPQYRLCADGDVEVRGQASHASVTAVTAINSTTPLLAPYIPALTRYYRGADPTDTAGLVMIDTAGVFSVRANASFPSTQVLMDGFYSVA